MKLVTNCQLIRSCPRKRSIQALLSITNNGRQLRTYSSQVNCSNIQRKHLFKTGFQQYYHARNTSFPNLYQFKWIHNCQPSLSTPFRPEKREQNFFTKTEILEIYKSKFKATYNGGEVDTQGVFANNELDMSEIDIFGFDYDYTLACYKESLHYLIYNLGRDVLINKYQYPRELENFDYIPDFAIRGLHYDVENGYLMKIDTFHQIQMGSVYRGLTPVPDEEVQRVYKGSYVPRHYIRSRDEDNIRMKQLNDLFSVPEMCLLSNTTEFFIQNSIPFYPEILYHDVTSAIGSIHPVIHKKLDEKTIGQYLEKNEMLSIFLKHLKDNGKKMFVITNSPFQFVDNGMKHMIGDDWQSFFDIVVVQARKPKFFTQQSRPFRKYNVGSDRMAWTRVSKLEKGEIYMEGTVFELLKMTGWHGSQVIYFGDQIFSDLADITLNFGWRTGAIIAELEKEVETLNSSEFREAVSALQALQQLVDEGQENNLDKSVLNQLIQQRDALRFETKTLFNPQFGSIFRTHHNPTYFSRRLFRYSDIYMSHITNLLKYSLKHTFLPRRGLLPHETRISQVELINRGDYSPTDTNQKT